MFSPGRLFRRLALLQSSTAIFLQALEPAFRCSQALPLPPLLPSVPFAGSLKLLALARVFSCVLAVCMHAPSNGNMQPANVRDPASGLVEVEKGKTKAKTIARGLGLKARPLNPPPLISRPSPVRVPPPHYVLVLSIDGGGQTNPCGVARSKPLPKPWLVVVVCCSYNVPCPRSAILGPSR